jgi:hypothetical protein
LPVICTDLHGAPTVSTASFGHAIFDFLAKAGQGRDFLALSSSSLAILAEEVELTRPKNELLLGRR